MNKLTPEELLRPRVKVIGPYPGSPFKVEQILTLNIFYEIYANGPFCIIKKDEVVKYPNIFQPIEWWEERTEDEMPEFLKEKDSGKIIQVTRYAGCNTVVEFGENREGHIRFYLPATEAEYNNQNAKL